MERPAPFAGEPHPAFLSARSAGVAPGGEEVAPVARNLPPLPTLVERFLLYLAAERGRSAAYRSSIRQSLTRFHHWCAEREVQLGQVTLPLLSDYVFGLHAEGLSPSSCRVAVVHLRIFFRYLHRMRHLPANPAALLEGGRAGRHLPETLAARTVARLLESINPAEIPYGARDRAILEMLYGSGLRVSELVNLSGSQVDWEEGFLLVRGKGSKQRQVPMGGAAARALRHYLAVARPLLEQENRRVDALFLSNRGGRLTRERIRQIIKTRASEAGLEENVYPHLMRHSFATHLLENGADLRVIQDMLGHSDLSTTQVYTHLGQKQLVHMVRALHPRGKK